MGAEKMNERIRELMEQAGLETQPSKLKIYTNDDGTVTSGGWEYPLEKFAELIVKECMQQLELVRKYRYDRVQPLENQQTIIDECQYQIKQHFGVEE
jgi:hypothetical protein